MDQVWIKAGPKGILMLIANQQTYQVGARAHFEDLDEGVLMALLDPRYTQVRFNSISVQVCDSIKHQPEALNLGKNTEFLS